MSNPISIVILFLFLLISVDPVKIVGKEEALFNIRNVVIHEDILLVLSGTEPHIHVYQNDSYITFGNKGPGPFEFNEPVSICMAGDTLYVLDFQPSNNKLITFTLSGERLEERPLDHLFMARSITCNERSGVITDSRRDVGANGQISAPNLHLYNLYQNDHILSIQYPEEITIPTPSGPMRSWSLSPPFHPIPQWALQTDGTLAYWDDESDLVNILSVEGEKSGTISVPDIQFELTDKEIDSWLEREYPEDRSAFGMSLSGLRDEIIKRVQFPGHFPKIGGLRGDPEQGIWVLHARHSSGEIWSWVKDNEHIQTYKFPAGNQLVAIGKKEIGLKVEQEDGFELIEIFNKEDLDSFSFIVE
ncbi:MAG: hypothetical protein ACNA78_03455 [Balneolaceae bacterium]